jgi:hypothetical protein
MHSSPMFRERNFHTLSNDSTNELGLLLHTNLFSPESNLYITIQDSNFATSTEHDTLHRRIKTEQLSPAV